MKRSLSVILALTLVLSVFLASCGEKSTAKKEEAKEVTVYSPNQTEIINPIVKEFQDRTGIKVNLVTGGTGELLKRIQAEKDNPLGDVIWGGGAESLEAYKDYFEPYKSTEDAAIDKTFKSATNHWTGFTALPMVILYNKSLVSEDKKPQGWADLSKPEWKGKIAYTDPAKSGSAYTQLITMVAAMGGQTQGWEFVNQFSNNLDGKIQESSSYAPKKTSDGEYALGLTLEESAYRYVVGGSKVGIIYPKEGTSAVPDGVAIIKGAKHIGNAKKFLDFTVGKDVQNIVVKDFMRRSVRNDIAAAKGLPAMKEMKLVNYNFDDAAKNKDQYLAKWKGIFTK